MKSALYGIIISIHAPREGGDFPGVPLLLFPVLFQSTPPARGATFYMAALLTSLGISIHAPREGGDVKIGQNRSIISIISIHAPREGGDNEKKCHY